MSASPADRIAEHLQEIMTEISLTLRTAAGIPCGFVLLASVGDSVQYGANITRQDSVMMLTKLLAQWGGRPPAARWEIRFKGTECAPWTPWLDSTQAQFDRVRALGPSDRCEVRELIPRYPDIKNT